MTTTNNPNGYYINKPHREWELRDGAGKLIMAYDYEDEARDALEYIIKHGTPRLLVEEMIDMLPAHIQLFNGVTEAQAIASLDAVAAGGKQTHDVFAYDYNEMYACPPQTLLEALGRTVIAWGDTGGHAYAISEDGIYLSSNGFATHVADPKAKAAELRERGFEGVSLREVVKRPA